MFSVTFQYDETERKWDAYVTGAANAKEACEGFNAVLLTASQATPGCNIATLQADGRYLISVGLMPKFNNPQTS